MGQLVVRNLPDEVKDRLKRRAERHGRSLEAEVRDILSQAIEPEAGSENSAHIVAQLVGRLSKIGITEEDVDALNESIAELRQDRRVHKLDKPRK